MRVKYNKAKVLDYFLANPTTRLRVRQIEREVKVSLPSAIRYAKELEQDGILKVSRIADVTLFSAYRSSKFYLVEKKMFNVKMLVSCGLIDHLISEFDNPTIVLFGSYAKGEDTEKSDIDLYVQAKERNLDLSQFEKKLNRKIQLFMFNNIRDIDNKELANNIINGVVLNGFLEVF